jgi:hypothetical protein
MDLSMYAWMNDVLPTLGSPTMQHLIRCIVVGVVGRTTAFIVVTTSLLNFGRWASGAPEKCHAGLNALLESQMCLFGKTYLMNRI